MSIVYTLAELADYLGGCFHGDGKYLIQGLGSLNSATPSELTYFDNHALLDLLKLTKAGAVLLNRSDLHFYPFNTIVVDNPLACMELAATLFRTLPKVQEGEIHPTAIISPSVCLGKRVSLGAHCVIGENVILADEVSIASNTVIEAGVKIGRGTHILDGVHIHSDSKIGENVLIESGVIIGASPFNSVKEQGSWLRGPALGSVVVADQVKLGANTVIAKGALGDTYIGEGVHIDNLVQIAHDVIIGAHSAIAGCAAIGAYTQIGSHCIIGGAACVAAKLHLVDDVVITGMSTVSKSLSKPGIYSSGIMVSEHQRWRRNAARFRRLDDFVTRFSKLEKEWKQRS